MQINTPYPGVRDDGDYEVRLNTYRPEHPFAIISLSEDHQTGLTIESVDEADRLIKAATEAKRLLSLPAREA